MTTVRDRVLPTINNARSIVAALGFRPYSLTIVTRTWTGTHVGEGTSTDSRLTLSPQFKTRIVSSREVMASVGQLHDGDLVVGPITPAVAVIQGIVQQTGTGTGTVAVAPSVLSTGVTQGKWQLVVSVIDSGVSGGSATFQYSVDGGSTVSSTQAMTSTFQVPGIGALLTFAGTFVAGDTYSTHGVSVGYTPAQLRPVTQLNNVEVIYELTGRSGVFTCSLIQYNDDRALRDTIYLARHHR